MKRALAIALLAALPLLGGCSSDDRSGEERSGGGSTPPGTTAFDEGTLALTTSHRKKEGTSPPEGTLGEEAGQTGDVVLRLEGDAKTRFSGICTAAGEENVLSGQVPQRFVFDLGGGTLDCRIEKQDPGKGSLKAILLVGDSTRSVQQTNTRGGTIALSFDGD